jgi:hypothetical protein
MATLAPLRRSLTGRYSLDCLSLVGAAGHQGDRPSDPFLMLGWSLGLSYDDMFQDTDV